jgi:signal transduction histidine kinase/CheY-like chemotaxis protein/HPt (histidine-containing phosphotransfer) domain-containing protein
VLNKLRSLTTLTLAAKNEAFRRRLLVERYTLLALAASVVYIVVYLSGKEYLLAAGIGSLSLFYIAIYFCNKNSCTTNPTHGLLWITHAYLLVYTVLVANKGGVLLLYFPLLFICLTLFVSAEKQKRLYVVLGVCLLAFFVNLGLLIYVKPIWPITDVLANQLYYVSYFTALVAILASGITLVNVHNTVRRSLYMKEQHHQALLQGIPDQILHFNLSGICLDFKGGFTDGDGKQHLGSSDTRYIGQPLSRLLPYKLSHKLIEKARSIDKGESFTSFEWKNQTKVGLASFQEFRINRISPGEFIAIIRDNTGKYQQQEHIKAKEDAEHAVKVKSEFLSSMSHEIRTPMNIVLGLSKLLIKDKSLSADALENAEAIRFSAENLLAIVNDILDLSKIEAGKLTIVPKAFNLKDLIKRHVNFMKVYAAENNLEVVGEVDTELPECLIGDEVRINQVLMNLTGNAIKFTKEGRVTVALDVLDKTRNTVKLKFSVKDTGVGIPQEKLRYIFEQFSQLQEENGSRTGTGLGLTISQRLVQLMGGNIGAESTIGLGSTFSFELELPIKQHRPADHDQDSSYVRKIDLNGIKILLAEDNSMNQFYARQLLSSWNVEIELANNGIEVVHKSRSQKFDIILMDLQMPVMDGYEAIKELRDDKNNPNQHTPVICVSADAFAETRNKAIAAGMNDYLTKPIDEDALIDILTQYTKAGKNYPSSAKGTIGKREAAENAENAPLLDLNNLSPVLKDDPIALSEFLTLFIRSVREDMEKLSSAILMNNDDQIGKVAHKLKSSYKNIGAVPSSRLLEQIESQAKIKPLDQQFLADLYRELMVQYQAITLSINEQMRSRKSAV